MLNMGIKFKNFKDGEKLQNIVLQCPNCGESMDWLVYELDQCLFCCEDIPLASKVSSDATSRLAFHFEGN